MNPHNLQCRRVFLHLLFSKNIVCLYNRWCKALCIVIIFFVFWYICLSSSLTYFKNCPQYLTRGTVLWWDFFCKPSSRKVFLLFWGTFFYFFVHLRFICIQLQYYLVILFLCSSSIFIVRSIIIIILIIIFIIISYSFRVFHISINWWFCTGVWVTASLLKSPGLVSGFWPFLAMLSFG